MNNVIAAGSISGNLAFNFGGGVSVSGASTSSNSVLVKYNSTGTALLAQSTAAGSAGSAFNSITADGSGNIYAVGFIGSGGVNFGGNSSAVTGNNSIRNTVIVKYNSANTAQWAQTLFNSPGESYFNGVAIDGSGNTYAVGAIPAGVTDFGGISSSVTGNNSTNNTVIVKYGPN